MTLKRFAKTSAAAVGMIIFPIRPIATQEEICAHVAAVQAQFASAVKDDLKPTV